MKRMERNEILKILVQRFSFYELQIMASYRRLTLLFSNFK